MAGAGSLGGRSGGALSLLSRNEPPVSVQVDTDALEQRQAPAGFSSSPPNSGRPPPVGL
eukprot:CAMPEP_0177638486 /NCGR_PEP_ID=MMETSP0447-20121125/5513_1 /TAXON_ID=0 /ORGANISM="Stygamoeba regulata, Strain BSH-02190019" /LENGTH=58 /DNA_ID=CAMNT_0019140449 /DNA_START=176 /DNA_END=352 /DNA_ORIENTATION=-